MEYYEFRAMNSAIVMAAEGTPDQLERGFLAARKTIENYERRFTRFSEHSELAELNRSAGSWFCASPAMFELVSLSRQYYQLTGRLFDPAILPDLKQAGYNQSLDEIRIHGASSITSENYTSERPVFAMLELDEDSERIFLPAGMEIDLGGIAKGWIAEQAAKVLYQFAPACAVNAGGDMYLCGLPANQIGWEVALEDPSESEQDLALLRVGPGAVATSSITKRNWLLDGRLKHHLIDPRRGEPADTEWLSVTVIAPQAAAAEVFAKVLLIGGADLAMELVSEDSEISFIAVDREKSLWASARQTAESILPIQ
jgi:thiamine biosynthesis lipoprotein